MALQATFKTGSILAGCIDLLQTSDAYTVAEKVPAVYFLLHSVPCSGVAFRN